MAKIAYYPGNVARAGAYEVEDCIQPLCKIMGINLVELPKASSDGGNIIRQSSQKLQDALVARNLALAEQEGLDVLTPCATSHAIMAETSMSFHQDPVYASSINNLIARHSKIEYMGESKSWHLLHYLVEEIGLDKLTDKVKNPINMNVACYYGPNMQAEGCCAGDDVFMPTYMEQVIRAIGGTPVEFDLKCSSVGTPSLLSLEKSALKMTADVLSDAKSNGADILVTACTLSHQNLDSYQTKAGKVTGKSTSMPIVHFTEILAFALGVFPDRFAQLHTRAILIGS